MDSATQNKLGQTKLWVETDNEPDDIFGMIVLKNRGFTFDTVVVGESDALRKVHQIYQYFGTQSRVIRGFDSSKNHPIDNAVTDRCVAPPMCNHDRYAEELKSYVKRTFRPIMVITKPPRELLRYLNGVADILGSVDLYIYGSFNLRSLKIPPDALHDLFQRFKNVHLMEAYHALGSYSSLNVSSAKKLHDVWFDLCSSSLLIADVNEWMRKWNNHILGELDDPYDNRTAEARRVNRTIKASVLPHVNFQFVAADMVLALFVGNPPQPGETKVAVDWDCNGYTVKSESSFTNVYLYENLVLGQLEERLCRTLAKESHNKAPRIVFCDLF